MTLEMNCALATDAVIFSGDTLVMIRRKNQPYKNMLSLPGGFVDRDETTEEACVREVKEETNLDIENLELVGIFSDPGRDPRGRVVSAAYLVEVKDIGALKAGDDAKEIELVTDWKNAELAFDHRLIIEKALVLKMQK
jgi:8-oxo-dGTP diphosphatase